MLYVSFLLFLELKSPRPHSFSLHVKEYLRNLQNTFPCVHFSFSFLKSLFFSCNSPQCHKALSEKQYYCCLPALLMLLQRKIKPDERGINCMERGSTDNKPRDGTSTQSADLHKKLGQTVFFQSRYVDIFKSSPFQQSGSGGRDTIDRKREAWNRSDTLGVPQQVAGKRLYQVNGRHSLLILKNTDFFTWTSSVICLMKHFLSQNTNL